MRVYVLNAISRTITNGQSMTEMLDSTSGAVGVFLTREAALNAMDAYPSVDGFIEPTPYIHDVDGYPWHKTIDVPDSEMGFEIEEFEVGSLYPFAVIPRTEYKPHEW